MHAPAIPGVKCGAGAWSAVAVSAFPESMPRPHPRHPDMLATPRAGVPKERMRPADMFVLDAEGGVLESPEARPPPYKPPKLTECAPLFQSVSGPQNPKALKTLNPDVLHRQAFQLVRGRRAAHRDRAGHQRPLGLCTTCKLLMRVCCDAFFMHSKPATPLRRHSSSEARVRCCTATPRTSNAELIVHTTTENILKNKHNCCAGVPAAGRGRSAAQPLHQRGHGDDAGRARERVPCHAAGNGQGGVQISLFSSNIARLGGRLNGSNAGWTSARLSFHVTQLEMVRVGFTCRCYKGVGFRRRFRR